MALFYRAEVFATEADLLSDDTGKATYLRKHVYPYGKVLMYPSKRFGHICAGGKVKKMRLVRKVTT